MTSTDHDQDYGRWLDGLAAHPRFGPDDRRGTANYIDRDARRRAVASMTTGLCTSLARPLSTRDDPRPGEGLLTVDLQHHDWGSAFAAMDVLHVAAHGQRHTHLDALNHYGRHGTWYSGFAPDDAAGPSVADLAHHKLFTRAVFADIPAVRGTAWVDAAHPVTGEDIDAALDMAGVEFESGDALILYMGRDRWESEKNALDLVQSPPTPGAGSGAARWIVRHEVSLLCWDFLDCVCESEPWKPIHLLMWAVGLVLVDNCDLHAVQMQTRTGGSAVGGLVVAPPALPVATGALVDPLLIQ